MEFMAGEPRVDLNTARGPALLLPIEPDDRVVFGEGLQSLAVSLQRTDQRGTLIADRPPDAVRDQRPGHVHPGGM